MSKSLGNFFTLKQLFEKFDPMVVRFFLLSTHYRSPINYSEEDIKNSGEGYRRIVEFTEDLDFRLKKTAENTIEIEIEDLDEELNPYRAKFKAAMEDDFNSAGALAAVFELIKYCRKSLDEGEMDRECLTLMRESVTALCAVLGLKLEGEKRSAVSGQHIEEKIQARETARKNKDFKLADAIRKELEEKGVLLEDTPYGTKWKVRS